MMPKKRYTASHNDRRLAAMVLRRAARRRDDSSLAGTPHDLVVADLGVSKATTTADVTPRRRTLTLAEAEAMCR
jgi:hypothetical protein